VIHPDTVLRLHALAFRDGDDSDEVVVGRPDLGEFVELPRLGAAAVTLLGAGLSVRAVEERIAREHGVELDVVELAEALVELSFAAAADGTPLPDPADERPGAHLPWLRAAHVRWLFGRTATAVWCLVALAAVATLLRRPDLVPSATDFYWTPYVGLAVLVGTLMFSVNLSVHELMHLAAARSYGAPARIGFSTRLHYLVVQTDVTAIWALPRRARYRVYLAGLRWDSFTVSLCVLLIAHVRLPDPAERLLAALAVTVVLSMVAQAQVYVRTDLYYVLMEVLRARNLYQDGLAYLRYLWHGVRRGPTIDPGPGLPTRERRGVRVYAVAMALGCAAALTSFLFFGLPILVHGIAGAVGGLVAGPGPRALDSALVILVEGALQALFVVTFVREHRERWRRRRRGCPGRPRSLRRRGRHRTPPP
jgi:putative peptide zinc metalloprotease protein